MQLFAAKLTLTVFVAFCIILSNFINVVAKRVDMPAAATPATAAANGGDGGGGRAAILETESLKTQGVATQTVKTDDLKLLTGLINCTGAGQASYLYSRRDRHTVYFGRDPAKCMWVTAEGRGDQQEAFRAAWFLCPPAPGRFPGWDSQFNCQGGLDFSYYGPKWNDMMGKKSDFTFLFHYLQSEYTFMKPEKVPSVSKIEASKMVVLLTAVQMAHENGQLAQIMRHDKAVTTWQEMVTGGYKLNPKHGEVVALYKLIAEYISR
mmetsp:Transcript_98174/g.194436  ORF Transcript_98174/g.194436 Transcript_98174/m.194436 type:complete len:264 (+) Transcript_98174:97-888(+)